MRESPVASGPLERPRRWPVLLERMVDFTIDPDDRLDQVRTKRLFTAALWASIIPGAISVFQLYLADAPWAAVAVCIPIVGAVAILIAMWVRPATYPGVMHVVAGSTMATVLVMMVIFGGILETGVNLSWGLLVVLAGAAIFADRRAHLWLAVFIAITILGYALAQRIEPLYVLPNRDYFTLFNITVVCVFIYTILYYFVRQSARLYDQSENLLRNILPDQVVERLKQDDQMIADDFAAASILFADVAGFTPMSTHLEPDQVVGMLNEVFTAFDGMVTDSDLEKIKTIGDAYMVGAGVPVTRDDHAVAICDLALAMQAHLVSHRFGGRRLQMRIGIASGPVMAGIIGTQKFSYDLWGDTVNLASRMESTGTPGRIQLSDETRRLVDEWFECEERGLVDVKGKGTLTTWYLVGRR